MDNPVVLNLFICATIFVIAEIVAFFVFKVVR